MEEEMEKMEEGKKKEMGARTDHQGIKQINRSGLKSKGGYAKAQN